MFLYSEVVLKKMFSFVKFFCLMLTFCCGFSAEVDAQKIRVDASRYLKIVSGKKPSGDDAIIDWVKKSEATDFTVKTLWSSKDFSQWNKQIIFGSVPLVDEQNSQHKLVYIGCDDTGALKLFSAALLADKPAMKNNVIWQLKTYCLKGSVLVETVLEFGRWRLFVEHPVLDVNQ